MALFGFLTTGNAPKSLMHRMMAALGVYRQLRELPGHAAVEARAAGRCSHCTHETECANWLAENENPEDPPEFCSNRDLIARLRKAEEAR